MRVLLDTNVLMDCVAERMGFAENAKAVLRLCMEKTIEGCIAAHSVMNLFYILRKHLSLDERRRVLLQFCKFLSVVKIDKTLIIAALQNDGFTDVEDCLQSECAKAIAADYIVTRNVKDFADSPIPAIPPDAFLRQFAHGNGVN